MVEFRYRVLNATATQLWGVLAILSRETQRASVDVTHSATTALPRYQRTHSRKQDPVCDRFHTLARPRGVPS